MDWLRLKIDLVEVTGLSKDALHIYAAVGLQLAVAAASRRGLDSLAPWLCVFVAMLANEALDLVFVEGRTGPWRVVGWQIDGGIHDAWNTMLLPTLLLLLARFAPGLVSSRAVKPAEATEEAEPAPDVTE